jgi:hypothetical protein
VGGAAEKELRFQLQAADAAGNPINSVAVGETFTLQVSVQDLRADPTGVFSAYLDVMYDASRVAVNGPITYNADKYPFAQSGSTAVAGLVDEAGA